MQGQSELCQPWYHLQSAEMAQVFVFISLFLRLAVFVLIFLFLRFTVPYYETLSIYWQNPCLQRIYLESVSVPSLKLALNLAFGKTAWLSLYCNKGVSHERESLQQLP